ncbi:ABC transporter ATP-binding protein [Variovorax boronicumulans]|uniref:ABC transporter ATP-binding protein n=1 Tax=Variovorax boronicumulans TaxID=436515 RepID=UPI0033920449
MSASVLLAADNLGVHVGNKALLRDVSFSLRPGDVLTLLGESGAGKSLLAQAVMGNLPSALRASGSVTLDGTQSRADDARARRPRWGRTLALLPQEPSLALDPLMRIAPQLSETHELVRGASFDDAEAAALRDLQAAGLPASARQYPWQLSGGMAQRAAAAVACAGGARILLADEPTKGLDAHWRDHTVAMLQGVQRGGGCVVVITHDLRVAQALGGQLIVLCAGDVVERGDARAVLADPQHAFTRRLVAADPARWPRRASAAKAHAADSTDAPVLSAQGLSKGFGGKPLFDGLDVQIRAGDRFVVQGASGTGKSTLGNVLLGLMPADRGTVRRAAGLHATAFQKLYQDPVASFAPQVSLAQSLRDVAARHRCAWPEVLRLLDRMGVPHELLARRPAQVSGGELQRVALARVLTVQPALVFADEPTSRLDPVSQQEAMAVLLDALDERGAALMLVTHDDDMANAVATQRWHIVQGGVSLPAPARPLRSDT